VIRHWWPVAWIAAGAADVCGMFVAVVTGNWYAVAGWACASMAALGAAGAGAMFVRIQRDTGL
jgi:hypothetical protein